jgi:hypothetical protein
MGVETAHKMDAETVHKMDAYTSQEQVETAAY